MYRQVNFLLTKDLGFNKEQLMVISSVGSLGGQAASFKEVARQVPGVKSFSFSTTVPGRNNNNNGYMLEGRADETFLMFTNWADYDFIKTYEMEMNAGRFFEQGRGTDSSAYVNTGPRLRHSISIILWKIVLLYQVAEETMITHL